MLVFFVSVVTSISNKFLEKLGASRKWTKNRQKMDRKCLVNSMLRLAGQNIQAGLLVP
jgi:hypothetical protein